MKTCCFILASIALMLPGTLFSQETKRALQPEKERKALPDLVIPPLRPKVAQLKPSSSLIYPVNPPRATDGQRIEIGSTNFAWMYPVNPPRLVNAPARTSVIPPAKRILPK